MKPNSLDKNYLKKIKKGHQVSIRPNKKKLGRHRPLLDFWAFLPPLRFTA
jgi:hypothetical protein